MLFAAGALTSASGEPPDPKSAESPIDFQRQIAPLFREHCLECHGPEKQKSGYRLDVREVALRGGDSGDAAIVPGQSAQSPLLSFIRGDDAETQMPPRKSGKAKLSGEQIALVRAWIDQGAAWPVEANTTLVAKSSWWSLQPIRRSDPPLLFAEDAVRAPNAVDAFVFAKLREAGLQPAPEADRRTLIRRLSFDLIGLPPTSAEVDAFLADPDPRSYEQLVDRLLASPRYGERWARHWLDLVHFGETHGYDKDQPRPNAWPYRDYVIRALNADKPFARFVQEQIAGDVLFPGTADGMEALGFIAAGPWDLIGHAEVSEEKTDGKIARHLDRDDMVANTMSTFASLTVHCAQCHDHKFDPILQEDYYSLQAVFAAVDRTDKSYDLDPLLAARRAALTEQRQALAERKSKLEQELSDEADVAENALAEADFALSELPPARVAFIGAVHHGSGNFLGTGASGGKPRPIVLLARGDVKRPGKLVQPGALTCIASLPARFDLTPNAPEGERRAALARWLSARENPLPWRSIVNRVWQGHFGRGLVETPNDFGKMGALPSHPALLDFLAITFRDEMGGSLKALHRLIVTSAAYRQRSDVHDAHADEIDAENRLLWRMPRRKLEAEVVRDSVLAVAGKLDLTMGGPSFRDFVVTHPEHSPHYEYHLADPEDPRLHRRSIYRFLVRSQQQPWMAAMDCADPSILVDRRNETVTPLQALAQLNDALIVTMARHFAERVEVTGADLPSKVTAAFHLAFQRDPSADELQKLSAYAAEHGMANACRLMLNLNEFAFAD